MATYFNLWTQEEQEWTSETGGCYALMGDRLQVLASPQYTIGAITAVAALSKAQDREGNVYKVPCLFSNPESWIPIEINISDELQADANKVARLDSHLIEEGYYRRHQLSRLYH
jgi:hypothetical protein